MNSALARQVSRAIVIQVIALACVALVVRAARPDTGEGS